MPQAATLVEQSTSRILDQFGRIQQSSDAATQKLVANAGQVRQSVDISSESIKQLAEAIKGVNKELEHTKEHESEDIFEKIFHGLAHPFENGNWDELSEGVGEMIAHPFRTAGLAAKDLLVAIGPIGGIAVGAGAGLFELGKQALELVNEEGLAARQTQNFANMLGLGFEETKKLGEMAQIVDADIGGLARASFRLAEALEDPTGAGKRQAEALQKLGVAAEDSGEALLQVLQKLSEVPDKTKRVELAHQLLGRASFQLIPLIENYDRLKVAVDRLGGSLSAEGVKKLLDAREATNEWSIAWDHLKEKIASALAPLATFAVKLVTPGQGAEAGLEKQIEAAKVGLETVKLNANIGSASGADVKAAEAKLASLQKQKQALAETAAEEKAVHSERVAAAKAWEAANEKTLDGLRSGLEKAHTNAKELEGALGNTIKPLNDTDRAEKDKEWHAALKQEADLKLKIKALEKDQSGQGVAERNAVAEKVIENEKKIALTRVEIAKDAAKAMLAQHHVTVDQETAALLTAEAERFEIEKRAAERLNALKAQTAHAERKPTGPGISIEEIELEHQKKILEIRAQGAEKQDKVQDDLIKHHVEGLNVELEFQNKIADHVYELNERRAKETVAASEATASAEIEHASRVYARNKELVEIDFQARRISAERRLELLGQIEKKEYEVQMAAAVDRYQAEVKKGNESPEGNQKGIIDAQAKIQGIADQYSVVMDGLKARTFSWIQELSTALHSAAEDMNVTMAGSFAKWASGQEKFSKAFTQGLRHMEESLIESLAKQLIQWVEHLALKKAAQLGFEQVLTALHITSAAEAKAVDSAKGVAQVVTSANVGAAAAGSAVAGIPIIGPALVAPTAAATLAQLMAFAPIASFEHGGIVPATGMVMAHKNEMYLGTHLSDFVRDAAGKAASNGNAAGSGGGDVHNHYHAARGESPDSTARNSDEFKRAMRDGRLRFA